MYMKTVASSILIFGLLFIAVFGLTWSNHNLGHGNSGCIVAVLDGALCPDNIVNFVSKHFTSIQTFSNAILIYFVSIILLGLMASLLLLPHLLAPPPPILARAKAFDLKYNPFRQRLLSWLSLFEHSPSF